MKIAIAGASGLVGSALIPVLEKDGATVVRLVRSKPQPGEIEWHPNHDSIEPAKLAGFDVIINLAGENIAAGRWTDDQKRKIRDSRVNGTHLMSEAIAKLSQKPRVFICASATGIYGDRDDEVLDEQSESGGGFLAGVCREWEMVTEPASKAGVRVVDLRFGPIMANAIKLAIHDESIRGPLNVVSPHPVTNEEFTKTLGHVLNRPTALAIPAFAARLTFGEMADEMLLVSQRVMPKKLTAAGYHFQHPELEGALRKYVG